VAAAILAILLDVADPGRNVENRAWLHACSSDSCNGSDHLDAADAGRWVSADEGRWFSADAGRRVSAEAGRWVSADDGRFESDDSDHLDESGRLEIADVGRLDAVDSDHMPDDSDDADRLDCIGPIVD